MFVDDFAGCVYQICGYQVKKFDFCLNLEKVIEKDVNKKRSETYLRKRNVDSVFQTKPI